MRKLKKLPVLKDDWYDPDCQICKREVAKLNKVGYKIGRIELRADYNSAGHLTHYHIEVYRKH